MKITGMEDVEPADFTACVIYSQLEATGKLTTSNEKVNRLIENVVWGQRGNSWMSPLTVHNVTNAWVGQVMHRYFAMLQATICILLRSLGSIFLTCFLNSASWEVLYPMLYLMLLGKFANSLVKVIILRMVHVLGRCSNCNSVGIISFLR